MFCGPFLCLEGIIKFFKGCGKRKSWSCLRGFRNKKSYPNILVLSEIVTLAGAPEYPIFSKISNPASEFMIS